ncbi:MAG: hypothetical protein AVDCRST_MAG04-411, partial [uncultured Acetobacteraceae bacterium]
VRPEQAHDQRPGARRPHLRPERRDGGGGHLSRQRPHVHHRLPGCAGRAPGRDDARERLEAAGRHGHPDRPVRKPGNREARGRSAGARRPDRPPLRGGRGRRRRGDGAPRRPARRPAAARRDAAPAIRPDGL